MMRRDRQSASDGPRMGVIRRAALLRTRPASARGDWLALVAVGGLAVVVLLFVSGVLGTGPTSAGPTDAPVFTVPGVGLATYSPEPTRVPTAAPSPTASPTFAATASPIATLPRSPIATLPQTPRPSGTPARAGLTILEPVDGAIFSERFILVRGVAPPGSIITRDIPLWFDDHTTADAAGRWSLEVQLERGENELTFRIGDDISTAKRLIVHLVPG